MERERTAAPTTTEHLWWQRGIIYQIYPRSFQDTNDDGIGDLPGITSRLDYLVWLGVDAIWISPIYPSPMADFGYDITDYTAIDPVYGTLADFDALLSAAHARGVKVLLDFVPNHTSDEHPWFLASRSARDDPKRDWYVWRDPAPDGGPPNNWRSVFGGSAWEFDVRTGQYYYHAYLREQPDLNWRNPAVREAMFGAMRFWLDRGVDGFRVDVMWHLIKDEHFRDNPLNPHYREGEPAYNQYLATYTTDRPEVHEVVAGMRAVLDAYADRVMVGEIYLPVERLVVYYGTDGGGAHLPFNFQLIELPWNARDIGCAIARYETSLPPYGWPNWVLGNHDKHRIASRVGPAQARVAAMLLLTLRGTPTMYYGDELGMHDVPIPPERVRDPWGRNVPGLGLGRDPERTPMQWSGAPHAGFSAVNAWLPVAGDYQERCVEREQRDPHSMLALYQRLIALRRATPALSVGSWAQLPVASANVVAYVREHAGDRLAVALNLGRESEVFAVPAARARVLISTRLDREAQTTCDTITLCPDEGVVLRLERAAHGTDAAATCASDGAGPG